MTEYVRADTWMKGSPRQRGDSGTQWAAVALTTVTDLEQ